MANQTRKRRRKHRGTQTGRVDTRSRSRPRNRQEAKARARNQRGHRHDVAPNWRSAIFRGAFAAAAFFLIVWLIFKRSIGQSLALAVFMLAFYIPLGYYTDRFFYNRRQRQKQLERERAKGDSKAK